MISTLHGLTMLLTLAAVSTSAAADLTFKGRLLPVFVESVPGLLEDYDEESGRFGTGIWICRDQEQMYPLAVAYSYEAEGNAYCKDKKLLEVIMKAGDALIDDADGRGQWVFRKKDGSTWGKIWMPWTYSRWMRTFSLIGDDMPPDRRKAWVDALTLGYDGISRNNLKNVHNIPVHDAAALYLAGKELDREAWSEQAAAFLAKAAGQQAEGGYWTENVGPVVNYNLVYLDSLGIYYALSGDDRVLSALQKGADFHYHFRYPNGERVETIDERNPYHAGIDVGTVGFSFTTTGRAYLQEQWSRYGYEQLKPDYIATLLLYGEEGPVADTPAEDSEEIFVLSEGGEDRAATVRSGPWFACLSAYTAPIPQSRWIQDRQNFVSIYHDKTGLILGGGNTKLQPAWSSFTIGDMSLLSHQPGDTNPNFTPKGELYHTPSAAKLVREPDVGLDLTYGPTNCRVRVRFQNDSLLEYIVEASEIDLPTLAHLTLIPHLDQALTSVAGKKMVLGEERIDWSPEEVGGQIDHAGYRLHLPPSASVHWPALPHNPYRKDGAATVDEARIEVRIPLDPEHSKQTIGIEILP